SLACFYYTLEKKYYLVTFFGVLAVLTRFTGFLLFFPVIIEYLESQSYKPKINLPILSTLLIPLGALLFPLYHYLAFGDFTLFLKVEESWGRNFKINYEHFQLNTPAALSNLVLDISYVLLVVLAIVLVFKKLRTSYGIYILGT